MHTTVALFNLIKYVCELNLRRLRGFAATCTLSYATLSIVELFSMCYISDVCFRSRIKAFGGAIG